MQPTLNNFPFNPHWCGIFSLFHKLINYLGPEMPCWDFWGCWTGPPKVTCCPWGKIERIWSQKGQKRSSALTLLDRGQRSSSVQEAGAIIYPGAMAQPNHPLPLFLKPCLSIQHHGIISPPRQHHPLCHSNFQRTKILLKITQILACAAISEHNASL